MYFHHFQVTEPLTFDPNLPLLAVLIESFSMLGYLFVPIKYRDTRRMANENIVKNVMIQETINFKLLDKMTLSFLIQ